MFHVAVGIFMTTPCSIIHISYESPVLMAFCNCSCNFPDFSLASTTVNESVAEVEASMVKIVLPDLRY